MSDNKFGWTAFYSEFADKLLEYRNNRKALIDKIIGMYNALAMTLPTLEQKGHDVTDIDPFTTFGLFNKGISDDNRRAICKQPSKYSQTVSEGVQNLLCEASQNEVFLRIPPSIPSALNPIRKSHRTEQDDNFWFGIERVSMPIGVPAFCSA